jgi:hypothetical protein
MSLEIKTLLGLRDTEKRMYVINTDEVTESEYEYCQVLCNVLWGDKGLVESLGPTWSMVHDARFENLESKFVVNRPAVFGGDARLGKQYIDGDGLLSHSMVELESYAEILGEGRHFHEIVKADGLDPREFYGMSDDILWKYIKQECPNYFDNKGGAPNTRANRLWLLFRGDLLGLIEDYSEVPLLQDWIKLSSGDQAEEYDFLHVAEEPVVWAEVDYLERALTLRASLRVSAVKVLQRSGLMALLQEKYEFTDQEIDEVLKLVYQTPYEKLYEVPAKVVNYANQVRQTTADTTKRMLSQCKANSKASKEIVAKLQAGDIKPINTTDEEVERDLSPEEKQVLAIQGNPYRLELFLMFVEAEQMGDLKTQDIIKPILEDTDLMVDSYTVLEVREKTLTNRTSSAVRDALS